VFCAPALTHRQPLAIISRLVDRHGSHCCGDSALARAASANNTLCFDISSDMPPCAGLEIRSAKAQGACPWAVGYSIRCENAFGLSCSTSFFGIEAHLEISMPEVLHGRRRIRRGGATEATFNHRCVLLGTSMIHKST
jgi:hypothetical protein